MSETSPISDQPKVRRCLRFVNQVMATDNVLMSFQEPRLTYAVVVEEPFSTPSKARMEEAGHVLEVDILPAPHASQASQFSESGRVEAWSREAEIAKFPPPTNVTYQGVAVVLQRDQAMLECDPEEAEALLQALVEFTHFEAALRTIEGELAAGWDELEADRDLAFDVKARDLKRSKVVGERVARVLQRRISFARMEPFLWQPARLLPAAAQKLGKKLREQAEMEARIETVASQLEVFEHIYEMGSQRMGETRAAFQTQIVEWIIIALLAGEILLMLASLVAKHGL